MCTYVKKIKVLRYPRYLAVNCVGTGVGSKRMKIISVVQYFNDSTTAVSTITEKYISFYNVVCIVVLNPPILRMNPSIHCKYRTDV